jgi:hypothetical protein
MPWLAGRRRHPDAALVVRSLRSSSRRDQSKLNRMITVTHRGNAIHVEDVEGEDTILLDLVPLAPSDDVDEAVAALRAEWSAEPAA